MNFKKEASDDPAESPWDVLECIGPILVVGTGIAFNGLVGFIALRHLGDTVSLLKLLVMEVPVASVYVSGGNRFSMLIHLGFFGVIAVSGAWAGNPGLALAAFGIMASAVLQVLHQVAWQRKAWR